MKYSAGTIQTYFRKPELEMRKMLLILGEALGQSYNWAGDFSFSKTELSKCVNGKICFQ